ncbi:hypothetical protein LTR86_006758 [Recurvomyces mirabilis]|nr:hypothetical protein LTR86_006758 [Recurvomyces mirabilis]
MADAEQQQDRITGEQSEQTPLLGGPGDASQHGKPLYHNFVIDNQLAAIVWGSVFSNDLSLFSAHPLLNSAAVLFFVQGVLILQPTYTAKQKKQGTYTHAALNDIAVLAAVAGLVIIEYNKIDHNGAHFESVHAILGLVTYILVMLQALVGITQFFTPSLYGGVDNAKALYKYHRVGGYITLLVMLATVCAATQTTFNVQTLKMQLWAVVVASVVIVLGLGARIKPSKFGWLAGQ